MRVSDNTNMLKLRLYGAAVVLTVIALLPASTSLDAEAEQDAAALKRQVEEALDDGDFRRVEVTVQGTEATLTGSVPHFWAKQQAIERAVNVDGIETVASELELPEPESDTDLAEEVAKSVQRYPHYTIWDYITGRVENATVYLGGWVTPDRRKAAELFERVAKIRGVQEVQSDIQTLSPAQSDQNLRRSIMRQLANNTHFERVARMNNPPFHILINNGIVVLYGYVQTQAEFIEMQRIVAQTQGVLRVDNQLQTLQ